MSENVSRRNFLKTAGVATGVAIAAGSAPFSFAQNEKVRVGCVGTGGQGSFHIRNGLTGTPDIDIVAVCDVYRPHQKLGAQLAQLSNAGITLAPGQTGLTGAQKEKVMAATKPNTYYDYREMLEKEQLDAIIIASPYKTHYEITMAGLDAGLYVFCEKTMAHEIEYARKVVMKCHETGKFVQVGHQRRYNPVYNKALMMAWEEGALGRINHIDAQWHRNNDWRRPWNKNHKLNSQEKKYIKDLGHHMNWRIFKDTSDGLMTELATHQLDIAAWLLDTMPSRVIGFQGLDYWRDGRTIADNVNLIYEFEVTPESRAFQPIKARNAFQDKQAINSPYGVRMMYSSITANAKKGCTELIEGDKGTFELTELGSSFFEEPTAKVNWGGASDDAEKAASVITSGGTRELSNEAQNTGEAITVDNDTPVDTLQFMRFARDVKTNGTPKANQVVGLRAVIMGLTGRDALEKNTEIKIDPAWYTFDFDVPSPSMVS